MTTQHMSPESQFRLILETMTPATLSADPESAIVVSVAGLRVCGLLAGLNDNQIDAMLAEWVAKHDT